MLRNHGWLILSILTIISVLGCSQATGPTAQSTAPSDQRSRQNGLGNVPTDISKLEPPAVACYKFLEAVRSGNDENAAKMLSTTAREKTTALNRSITPPASDTAQFALGKVDYIGEDGARVVSTWTDIDDEGQSHSDTAVWVLRREEQDWRIVGVAAIVFTGESPLMLNFEDPDDIIKKQQWVREEIRRRAEKNNLQAQETKDSDNSDNPIRK
jgi:hypothetical protein